MRVALAALALAALTVLAYLPALHAGYIWDDRTWLLENTALRTARGLWDIWFKLGAVVHYYPLVFTTFWVEYHLWGLDLFGYHLVNVLLHALDAIVLWRVLRCLEIPAAWLCAAVFALHPVNVESVAWITERKNVLSALFYLTSALCYLKFARPRPAADGSPRRRGSWWLYAGACVLFVCALLSKTVACVLPAGLLVVLWWKRERLRAREVAALLPMFVIGIALSGITVWIEREFMESPAAKVSFTLIDRVLIAGRALWFYPRKLLWPSGLAAVYPRWRIDPTVWWQYVYPAAAAALIIALWLLRRRIGRAPLAGVMYYAVVISPALGFVSFSSMNHSLVADHFQYLACVGLIVPGIGAARKASRRLSMERVAVIASALLLVVLGSLTWRQCHFYKNQEALWSHTISVNPNAWVAHYNLGNELRKRGDLTGAIREYQEAVRLFTSYPPSFYNLANVLAEAGRLKEAEANYRRALELNPEKPRALYGLAMVLKRQGRTAEALPYYRDALRLNPKWVLPLSGLAEVLATDPDPKLRNGAEAVALARRACELTDYHDARLVEILAAAFAENGQFDEAVRTGEMALKLARKLGGHVQAKRIEAELGLYRAGRPFHRTADDAAP